MTRSIVLITNEFYPRVGGISTYVAELAKASNELSYPSEVWAPDHPDLDGAQFPFPVLPMPVRGHTRRWSDRIRLARHLNRSRTSWQGSIVCLPEPGPLRAWTYMQLLGRFQPKTLVAVLHGSEIVKLTRWWHRRFLFRRLLERCERIGVVSNYVRDMVTDRYPDLRGRIVMAPGAPRTDVLSVDNVSHRNGRAGKTVLLTVGRIHPRKGQLAVIEALARLPRESRAEIDYRIAGPVSDQRYQRQLQRAADDAEVRVSFLGTLTVSELSDAYADADIFVMTPAPVKDSVEGFGLGYVEASAEGLPVIGHAVGGTADAVKHDETGLLVDPWDRAALADAIIKLVNDEPLRIKLGRSGYQWAREMSWRTTARALFEGLV